MTETNILQVETYSSLFGSAYTMYNMFIGLHLLKEVYLFLNDKACWIVFLVQNLSYDTLFRHQGHVKRLYTLICLYGI